MRSLANGATQVGLVVALQGLALVATPSVAPDMAPVQLVLDRGEETGASNLEGPRRPAAASGLAEAPVHTKRQDRLVHDGALRIAAETRPQSQDEPPRAAIIACQSKAEESRCTFSGGRGETVEGICRLDRAPRRVVCAPEGTARQSVPERSGAG